MKRSNKVDLTIVTLLAASFTAGCNDGFDYNNIKHCVDENGVVVPDAQCNNVGGGSNMGHVPFRWYYGGGRVFTPGTRVTGGSYVPAPGRTYSAPSTVTRSGFGSTGRSATVSAGE